MKKLFFIAIAMVATTAWAGDFSPNAYDRNTASQVSDVYPGTVLQVRRVEIAAADNIDRTAGAAIGGVVGYQLANRVGQGNGKTAAQLLGGVLGAYAGDRATRSLGSRTALEVVVAFDSGKTLAITQEDDVGFAAGQRVLLFQGGGKSRLVPQVGAMAYNR